MDNLNTSPESLLRALFNRAIEEADPMRVVPKFLPPKPEGRVVVIGAGKASAPIGNHFFRRKHSD